MTLAATGSPAVAEEVSYASGRELNLVGINWAYSPVADVNSDPRNPVIGKYISLTTIKGNANDSIRRCTLLRRW